MYPWLSWPPRSSTAPLCPPIPSRGSTRSWPLAVLCRMKRPSWAWSPQDGVDPWVDVPVERVGERDVGKDFWREMLSFWPCEWVFIHVSETSSPMQGRTHSLNSPLNNRTNNQIRLRNPHSDVYATISARVIGIPNMASPRPRPPPASFLAPALGPTNASNHGLTPQPSTACKDSYGVSSRWRRWSCVDNSTSGSSCVVHFHRTTVVMYVGWYVSCEVRWYVCVGSSVICVVSMWIYEWNVPTLCGAELFKLRKSKARVVSRCRVLTRLFLVMSYTNHARGAWRPGSALLVAENGFFVVEKRGRGAERWKTIREGLNLLNGWMKGIGRSGDVRWETEAEWDEKGLGASEESESGRTCASERDRGE